MKNMSIPDVSIALTSTKSETNHFKLLVLKTVPVYTFCASHDGRRNSDFIRMVPTNTKEFFVGL